jgi:periplasmic protein TonB
MNSKTILQSDLLDIVFENRNKEYGAYALRKHYEQRMRFSLLIMFGLVLIFFLSRFLLRGTSDSGERNLAVIHIHENKLSDFKEKTKRISMPVTKKAIVNSKSKSMIETTPRIVDEKLINKAVASANDPVTSNNIDNIEVEGNENLIDGNGMGMSFESTGNKIVTAGKRKVIEKKVLPVAEIMPQYPGGIKALLAYLKKNLKVPEGEIEEGEEVSVKVKFVVNYNGQVESFVVTESGGKVYDDEVLRVLKKIPLWIPGKSKGEKVSVYFTIPVKFTNEY